MKKDSRTYQKEMRDMHRTALINNIRNAVMIIIEKGQTVKVKRQKRIIFAALAEMEKEGILRLKEIMGSIYEYEKRS